MNVQQKEKLTNLLETSPMLSAWEKLEWLKLLDLMSSKQLGSLENILSEAANKTPGAVLPSAATKPLQLPVNPNPEAPSSISLKSGLLASFGFSKAPVSSNPAADKNVNQPHPLLVERKKENNKPLVEKLPNLTKPFAPQSVFGKNDVVKPAVKPNIPNSLNDGRVSSAAKTFNVPPPIPNPTQLPKLSHIMNLPRAGAMKTENAHPVTPAALIKPAVISPVAPVTLPKLQAQVQAKPKVLTRFGAKLNSILGEKELMAGKPNGHLELSAPSAKLNLSDMPPVPRPPAKKITPPVQEVKLPEKVTPVPKPEPVRPIFVVQQAKPESPVENKPEPKPVKTQAQIDLEIAKALNNSPKKPVQAPVVLPKSVTDVLENLKAKAALAQQPKKVEEVVKEKEEVVVLPMVDTDSLKKQNILNSEKPKNPKKPEDAFAPGINLKSSTDAEKEKNFAEIRRHLLENKPVIVEPRKDAKPTPPLNALVDLQQLGIGFLSDKDESNLLKKIKSLISEFGYHETVFNIEKSALYKSYLKTGLDALSTPVNLDELAKQNESYLNKSEFEKFTDFLRKIQVV